MRQRNALWDAHVLPVQCGGSGTCVGLECLWARSIAFEVDVAKLNDVMPSFMYPIGHPPKWPMTEVRACIEGEGVAPAPMEVLFAAFALRTGEAVVPACAFRGDTSMTSIELPAGLTSLGEYSFYFTRSLTSIALPASLTRIGKAAFYSCRSLHARPARAPGPAQNRKGT